MILVFIVYFPFFILNVLENIQLLKRAERVYKTLTSH